MIWLFLLENRPRSRDPVVTSTSTLFLCSLLTPLIGYTTIQPTKIDFKEKFSNSISATTDINIASYYGNRIISFYYQLLPLQERRKP